MSSLAAAEQLEQIYTKAASQAKVEELDWRQAADALRTIGILANYEEIKLVATTFCSSTTHLAKRWFPHLVYVLQNMTPDATHNKFLFLTQNFEQATRISPVLLNRIFKAIGYFLADNIIAEFFQLFGENGTISYEIYNDLMNRINAQPSAE